MTRDEAVTIAEQFVSTHGIEVGPIWMVSFGKDAQEVPSFLPHWTVYFQDKTSDDSNRNKRDYWPEIAIMVDDANGTCTGGRMETDDFG